MSAMLRFKSVEDFENFKKATGVREARPISGKSVAAPVRRAPATILPAAKSSSEPPPASTQDDRLALAAATPRNESEIERRFAQQIRAAGLPEPEREYYHITGRDFRLDFAWPDKKLGVEIQGMAHRIKSKFHADMEKRILAQLAGWTVLEFSGDMVRHDTAMGWLILMMGRKG
jgi:very-short-patch-repair endonuclease